MTLRTKIINRLRHYLDLPPVMVHQSLLGREYFVRQGTIHQEADYDEAWLLALSAQSRIVFDIGSNIGQAAFIILHSETVDDLTPVWRTPEMSNKLRVRSERWDTRNTRTSSNGMCWRWQQKARAV